MQKIVSQIECRGATGAEYLLCLKGIGFRREVIVAPPTQSTHMISIPRTIQQFWSICLKLARCKKAKFLIGFSCLEKIFQPIWFGKRVGIKQSKPLSTRAPYANIIGRRKTQV